MSTVKTTNIQHPSAASPSIVLASTGNATYAATHDFTAATVTGAGGLRLVTPTSIANSGGSASASGGAVTFSAVNSVSLNGVFTSSYPNYLITFDISTQASTAEITARLRVSGTDTITGYNRVDAYWTTSWTGGFSRVTNSTGTAFGLLPNLGATDSNGTMNVLSPQLAESTITNFAGSANGSVIQLSAGRLGAATSFDGMTLIASTGTITGKIRVYGYQNS
jgi:hypothetical protein